jgi:quercetin dioxygenase-like cupin family protein
MRYGRGLTLSASLVGLTLALLGGVAAPAEDVPPEGIVLDRMAIEGLEGMEAIAVYYEMPGGEESGRHKLESGGEIVYILEGAAILEVEGSEAVTVEAGHTFKTVAGQVHNVKNASDDAVCKAVSFYIGEAGGTGETIAVPVE